MNQLCVCQKSISNRAVTQFLEVKTVQEFTKAVVGWVKGQVISGGGGGMLPEDTEPPPPQSLHVGSRIDLAQYKWRNSLDRKADLIAHFYRENLIHYTNYYLNSILERIVYEERGFTVYEI